MQPETPKPTHRAALQTRLARESRRSRLQKNEMAVLDKQFDYQHNAVHIMIGEFEYVLITAAAILGESAYGATIREEIGKAAGRRCSIGALYTTIERLEKKGMLVGHRLEYIRVCAS